MNLNTIKTFYFVGIKGVGMSGLSVIAKELGKEVYGSDTDETFITNEILEKNGISPFIGFSKENVNNALAGKKADEVLVIVTAAHGGMGNVEVLEARALGFETVSYGKALGLFMEGKRCISVAGSHGKTTTTALLAHILTKSGKDPSYLIGTSFVPSLGQSAHAGKGELFIAEADEYSADPQYDQTPKFLYQKPEIIVITSIDWDHPDVFSSQKEVEDAFIQFINQSRDSSIVIANYDDPGIRSIFGKLSRNVITYGFSDDAMFQLSNNSQNTSSTTFTASHGKDSYVFTTSLSGIHNIANSAGAILGAYHAGVSIEDIQKALSSFMGSKRRLEKVGEINGVLLYDDYAHHPTEIKATLGALAEKFPGKQLIVIFQPHTYTRTKAFFEGFADSFAQASTIYITDIFSSSREKKDNSISSRMLVDEIKKKGKDAKYIKNVEEMMADLKPKMQQNDILVTMGAGDIYSWHKEITKLI
jgi:UDP-N-acetylmuramate--alanine ligase